MGEHSAKLNYTNPDNLIKRKKFHQEYSKPYIDLDAEVLKYVEMTRGNLLDMGCGYGKTLRKIHASNPDIHCTGADMSPGMIDAAKKANKNIDFFVSCAEDLPFGNNEFDMVICKHALYHFDIPKAVKEMKRVLRPGGNLILTLNSLQRSRVYMENCKNIIRDTMPDKNYADTNHRINLENYRTRFHDFDTVKEIKLFSKIQLPKIDPLVDYINTFREYWSPIPSQAEWNSAMMKVRDYLSDEISKKKKRTEKSNYGLIILKKNGNKN